MKKMMLILMMLALAGFVFAQPDQDPGKYQYVGVDACAPCHKTAKQGEQLKIWQEGPHSNAFETLKTEQAAEVAKKAGVQKAAHEAEECLACHATGYNLEAAKLGPKFDVASGVQCETCHGPGSEYKKMSIMKDREKALASGMRAIIVEDGSAQKFCVTCHNEKSPTFKGFNFEEMWPKIAHPVPGE